MAEDDAIHVRGLCWVVFAYDIGMAIDLARARALLDRALEPSIQKEGERHTRRAPKYFEFRPAPVRVTRSIEPLKLATCQTLPVADCTLYDFGAITVTYMVRADGPLEGLLGLSEDLYESRVLLDASRRLVETVLAEVRSAVNRPALAPPVEDYAIYRLRLVDGAGVPVGGPIRPVLERHAGTLAKVLRADRQELSEQEVRDAMSCQLSYTPEDAAIIDWNAAILFLEESEDVRSVLEFANVELLEMRQLDDQLDVAMEHSYQALTRPARRGVIGRLMPGASGAELRRVAELQMDSSLLFENVSNALKLLGDQYLARVYRLAAGRLHLPDWDASILRKLSVLESIYEKLADRQGADRMELLEWIVIVLIALEIVLNFVPGIHG